MIWLTTMTVCVVSLWGNLTEFKNPSEWKKDQWAERGFQFICSDPVEISTFPTGPTNYMAWETSQFIAEEEHYASGTAWIINLRENLLGSWIKSIEEKNVYYEMEREAEKLKQWRGETVHVSTTCPINPTRMGNYLDSKKYPLRQK